MPYQLKLPDGRIVYAPTQEERQNISTKFKEWQQERESRKQRDNGKHNVNEFGETPEQKRKRDYYVNLFQSGMNNAVEQSKKAAAISYANIAHNTERERLKLVEKSNFIKTGLSSMGIASGIAALATPLTSILYPIVAKSNAVIGGANAINDAIEGDYEGLFYDTSSILAPWAKFKYSNSIPTATWGRIGSNYVIDFSKHLESLGLFGDSKALYKQIKQNEETKSKLYKYGGKLFLDSSPFTK